jgi:hypothetical protein
MTTVACKACKATLASPGALVDHVKLNHPDALAPPVAMRWEDPPPKMHGAVSKLIDELRPTILELKRNPGRWARIREYERPSSGYTTTGHLKKMFPDVEFQAHKVGDVVRIWARYVEDGET